MFISNASSLLSEGLSPLLILPQLLLVHRCFSRAESPHEVVHRDGVDFHIVLIGKVQPGFRLSSTLTFSARLPFPTAEFPEPVRSLEHSHRLIDCIFDQGLDVTSWVPFRKSRQITEVALSELMVNVFQRSFEHSESCFIFRERNVNSSLKSSPNGKIKSLWEVGRSQNENSIFIVANSLHFGQKLCLNSLCGLTFVFRSTAAQRVDLVNEDDWWLLLSCKGEEWVDHFFTFSNKFAQYFGRFNRKECAFSFSCTSLGQKGFSSPWRTIEKDSFPRLSWPFEHFLESNRH